MCRRIGVRAVFISSGTLRQLLMKVKTPAPEMNRKEGPLAKTVSLSTLERLVHCTSLKKTVAKHKYIVCSEDRRSEERRGSTCMGRGAQSEVGWNRNLGVGEQLLEEKSPPSNLDQKDYQ